MTTKPAQRIYSKLFFKGQGGGSKSSAQVIVPLLLRLLGCSSVLDVGCGNRHLACRLF